MTVEWLDQSIGQCQFPYCLCISEKQLRTVMTRVGCKPEDIRWPITESETSFIRFGSGNKLAIVCIRGWENLNPINVACILVHEAVHIFQEHCVEIGEAHPSQEYEAYAIQWISQQLMHSFRKQTAHMFPVKQ